MYVKLISSSYVRCGHKYGHIANVDKNTQRLFSDTELLLLKELKYEWTDIRYIINKISQSSQLSTSISDILHDKVIDFYTLLKKDGYIDIHVATNQPNYNSSFGNNASEEELLDMQNVELPDTLAVEITNKCNERCIHCYIPDKRKSEAQMLQLNSFKKLIDNFVAVGGKCIRLTGGEVFTHKDFREMVEYCVDRKLSVALLSNLTLINDDDILFLKKHIEWIQTSLYSITEDVHDCITRHKGSCRKTKTNIEKLINEGMDISVAVPIMKLNQHNIVEVIRYGKERNINVAIEPIILAQQDGDKSTLSQRLTLQEIESVLKDIYNFDSDFFAHHFRYHHTDEDSKNFDFIEYLKKPLCEVGRGHICINAEGCFQPCTGWNRMQTGYVGDSLIDVWNSKSFKSLRKFMEMDFPICVSCENSDFCLRCIKRNDFETGDLTQINPLFCEIAKISKKLCEKDDSND